MELELFINDVFRDLLTVHLVLFMGNMLNISPLMNDNMVWSFNVVRNIFHTLIKKVNVIFLMNKVSIYPHMTYVTQNVD